jgi:hypothetical protein
MKKYSVLFAVGAMVTLSACGGGQNTGSATATTTFSGAPTESEAGSDSTPTSSPQPEMSPSPSDTGSESKPERLTLYYVKVGDKGASGTAIGCDDSLVAVETDPLVATDRVQTAMEELLQDKEATNPENGLTNALAASDLTYVDSKTTADSVTVNLSGEISAGGTCDTPRIEEQLTRTAATAAGTQEAEILVNGREISEVLSQQ